MLGEFFYWIFNMSIAATICTMPILLLRLAKRIPRRVLVWLWLIPFVRMCIPIGISGKYGIMTLISRFTAKTVTVYELSDNRTFSMMNFTMGANSYFPITYKMEPLKDLFRVASLVWILVSLAMMLALFIFYCVTLHAVKDARHWREEVYISDRMKTPAVYGIIRPKILLPREYETSDLIYILMHERAHIKRGDNFIRMAALIVVCIHWFNPFAWLSLKMLYSDMELSCDEAVLRRCNEAQKKEYALVLLSSVEKNSLFAATFGGAKIRKRIENILSYRRLSALSIVTFLTLVLAIAYALLTNAS